MAKNQPDSERYEYIRAVVDCGKLHFEYKLVGNAIEGRHDHDEDVENWSNEDIKTCAIQTLCVEKDQEDLIEVEYN